MMLTASIKNTALTPRHRPGVGDKNK